MHVVATAGHVDHGKSTLVKALTGTDPDRFAEERRRGLTIDLGFAWTTLPRSGAVEFVDVPGHIRFISNMLAGVAVVEAGLLCVDAREGWRAQSEEHLRILDLIGLDRGLVALTKVGLVDPARLAAVRDEVARHTAGSVLADAPVVACDALEGVGLDDLRTQLDELLATGRAADDRGRPRLWVDRSFTIGGAGTVVTGGVSHGSFNVDDRVAVVGSGRTTTTRIRAIQALGGPVDHALAGARAALNLTGIDRHVVRRGDAVVKPDTFAPTDVVDVNLTVLASLDHDLTQRGAYLAYVGTAEHAVRLRLLDATRLTPGSRGAVRLRFQHPLPLIPGDRVVLRETGRSELVGGGEIVDIAPGRGRGTLGSRSELVITAEHDWTPAHELERRLGVSVEPTVGEWVVSAPTLDQAKAALTKRLQQSRPVGLDAARLDDRERAVLGMLAAEGSAEIVAGYAVTPDWRDELARHPMLDALRRNLFAPPPPADVPPEILRAMLRRGLVMVKDGITFAGEARTAAARVLAKVAHDHPDGFTLSEARQALGTTRKWAVPLMELLDEARITIRHGDRRTLRATEAPAP